MELAHSQVFAFQTQIPLMYFIVSTNAAVLAINYYDQAPTVLTVLVPFLLFVLCAYRFFAWRKSRGYKLTFAQAQATIHRTGFLAFFIGAAFIVWSLVLVPNGNTYMQMHAVFFILITTLFCLLCLMHVRRAVTILSLTVMVPFVGVMIFSGNQTLISIALNYVLVSVAVMIILSRYYYNFVDLIESKQQLQDMHDRMAIIADTDSLTKLANRRQFFARLSQSLLRGERSSQIVTIGILDLDGFKPVNDTYGHSVGDLVLIEVAMRLRNICPTAECIARLGGDEFGIILYGHYTAPELRIMGMQICLALREPYVIDNIPAKISASIGFASSAEAANTTEQLYECADYALYYAKRNTRGAPVSFSADHKIEIRQNSLIDQRLRDADLCEDISMAYQPIIDTETGKPVAFEALARWTDPDIGIIPPDVFIQVAERNGHIRKLTEMLLEKTLDDAAHWPDHLSLSFNLSAYDIATREAASRIADIVANSRIPARRIELEVAETAVMLDFDKTRETLTMLKDCGMHISLDDFGSGYSSLNYVHQLPLDRIKIDRGFIANIEHVKVSIDVVRTIVDMCRSLSLDCVIEGVETQRQVALLRDMGCRWMQGYLFAKPMAASHIPAFLREMKYGERIKLADLTLQKMSA